MISSPFLLGATILHHMHQNPSDVAMKIANSLYVDNVLCGVSNVEEAKEFYKTSKVLFRSASMNLREWTSNNCEFRDFVP